MHDESHLLEYRNPNPGRYIPTPEEILRWGSDTELAQLIEDTKQQEQDRRETEAEAIAATLPF